MDTLEADIAEPPAHIRARSAWDGLSAAKPIDNCMSVT
jgi:hypothetical protein